MPDDPAAAMAAHRGQQVDRAFEAVEGVGLPTQGQLEALVVVVAAVVADSHESTSGVRVAVRAGDVRGGARCTGESLPACCLLPVACCLLPLLPAACCLLFRAQMFALARIR